MINGNGIIIIQALEKYRKNGGPLKCKQCVQAAEAAEREAAAQKRAAADVTTTTTDNTTGFSKETRTCAKCQQSLGYDNFNRNQWMKGEGKSKCRPCVEASLVDEQAQQAQGKVDKLAAAKAKVAAATTPTERVAAESEVAALEAQKVTGLQPVRLGRGGGRGRGGGTGRGGRGRGRGRK